MVSYEHEKENSAREITTSLYEKGFIQTLWNAEGEHADTGWTLKNGSWSPLYINLRQIGNDPKIADKIGIALSLMLHEDENLKDCNKVVGIEMAGIPIAVAASLSCYNLRGEIRPYLYTRPLAEKVRTVEEARTLLEREKAGGGYGEKYFLEGRLEEGDNLCLIDDVAMDFASNLIAL